MVDIKVHYILYSIWIIETNSHCGAGVGICGSTGLDGCVCENCEQIFNQKISWSWDIYGRVSN